MPGTNGLFKYPKHSRSKFDKSLYVNCAEDQLFLHPVADVNVRLLPGADMRELGLFAGFQGGPKYEQPSFDMPLHQASRAREM